MARTRLRGLTVAGLRVAIEAPPQLPWDWPVGPLRRFAPSPDGADMTIGVRVGRPVAPAPGALRYDSSGGIFDVALEGRDWVVALRIRGELQRVARFDADFRMGEVVVDPDSFYARAAHYPLAYPLDEVLYLHRLAREGGVMLHACGVHRGDRALLFSGPSGAGKTTIARRMLGAGDVRVLSDDRVVVRTEGACFRAFGTPWHGDAPLSSDSSAELAGIHLIHQSAALEVRPLAGAEAAARLLGNAFVPVQDPRAVARTLALAERIVQRVPVARLGCPNDASVVPWAWRSARPVATALAPL